MRNSLLPLPPATHYADGEREELSNTGGRQTTAQRQMYIQSSQKLPRVITIAMFTCPPTHIFNLDAKSNSII